MGFHQASRYFLIWLEVYLSTYLLGVAKINRRYRVKIYYRLKYRCHR